MTYLRLPQYLGERTEQKQEFREKSRINLFNKRYNRFSKNDVYFSAFMLDPPFLSLFSWKFWSIPILVEKQTRLSQRSWKTFKTYITDVRRYITVRLSNSARTKKYWKGSRLMRTRMTESWMMRRMRQVKRGKKRNLNQTHPFKLLTPNDWHQFEGFNWCDFRGTRPGPVLRRWKTVEAALANFINHF